MSILDLTRNPNLGDTITTNYRQLTRRNLSNQVQTFKSVAWATTDTFRFIVAGLSYTTKEEIIQFLIDNAGQEITIIDYLNITWTGVVVDDPHTEQVGRDCMWQITLMLEGTFKTPP